MLGAVPVGRWDFSRDRVPRWVNLCGAKASMVSVSTSVGFMICSGHLYEVNRIGGAWSAL